MDFVQRWSEKTEIGAGRLIGWLGITASKFYCWRFRYGCVNEHNGWIPREFWLEDWEKQAIINFHLNNPLEGYRRLTFMMLDGDIVAVSPSSVWRVLSQAGLLSKWNGAPSKKATGFQQPPAPQFIARDFKEFIRLSGMTHVRTSPYYPQSNGKLERWHKSLKSECIRPGTPLTPEEARRLIQRYVDHYNTERLHSAIGFVTPKDMIQGRQAEIHAARDRKLEQARRQRQLRRQQAA